MTMTMTMTEKHYTSFLNEFDVVTGQDRVRAGQDMGNIRLTNIKPIIVTNQ